MWAYIISILVLIGAIVLLVWKLSKNKKKFQLEFEKNQLYMQQSIGKLIQEHGVRLGELSFSQNKLIEELNSCHALEIRNINEHYLDELEKRNAVIKKSEENLKGYIDTSDELEIIELFVNMFAGGELKDTTIYVQLGIRDEMSQTNYRLDFLLVSPKGVYVIESKGWNGLTHIKLKSSLDILANSKFDSFGTVKGSDLKVISINEVAGKDNELRLSNYGHPIQQARNYSVKLKSKLQKGEGIEKMCAIKNIVVFSNHGSSNVFYNGDNLNNSVEIDKFTTITTFDNLRPLLNDLPNTVCDYKLINKIIESNIEYWCRFILDEEKYKEEPFKCLIKSNNKI